MSQTEAPEGHLDEVTAFLRGVTPFDTLGSAELDAVAAVCDASGIRPGRPS